MTDQHDDTAAHPNAEGTETIDVESTAAEDIEVETDVTTGKTPGKGGRLAGGPLRRVPILAVPALLLVVSAAFFAFVYFNDFRPDEQTDASVVTKVTQAAADGTVALLSYSPNSLQKDFDAAKKHMTGDFLSYYNKFTTEVITPAAKQNGIKTSATIVRSATIEVKPDSAVLLVFINQSTRSSGNPIGSLATSAVKVGLAKVNGHWLVASFDPV